MNKDFDKDNMANGASSSGQSFWEHLDVLRSVLLKIFVAVCVLMIIAFCFKEPLFQIVLAPKDPNFIFYHLLGGGEFHVDIINTKLASQFTMHVKVACYAGVLLASPYIIYQLFTFISPALYVSERRYAVWATLWGYLLFMIGVLLNYFIIFPLTFRFLSTYQVSSDVINTITLTSYIETLMTLCLVIGLVFEMPLLSWFLSRIGVLSSNFMRKYRRHAIVVVLMLAAIITPTSDIFTLMAVSLPIYMLYEASIFIVQISEVRILKQSKCADI